MLFVLYVAPAIEYETFEVTAYTAGAESTGKTPDHPAYGVTASGAPVEQGVTVACPPELAFGTAVYIPYFSGEDNGGLFECQDRGGAITSGKIDVYMDDLDEALAFGRRELDVAILNDNEGELRVKIRIIKASKPTYWYADRIGEVFEATKHKNVEFPEFAYRIECNDDMWIDGCWVNSADCEEIDDTAIRMDALEKRIAELESQLRVAQEDIVLIEEGVTDDIKRLESVITDIRTACAIQTVTPDGQRITNLAESLRKVYGGVPKQPTRDEIVAKAIADVAELERIGSDAVARLPKGTPFTDTFYRVDFVVNQNKRTIVALVKSKPFEIVTKRGITKCAPNDVFNAHIGKAIALRRALGLDVPSEFLNAPQPEKPRDGDLIGWEIESDSGGTEIVLKQTFSSRIPIHGSFLKVAKIIDDTASTERAAKESRQ